MNDQINHLSPQASLSSKVAQRMMLNLFAGGGSQRIEFVRMKGPQGQGHAEMAVTKPKGDAGPPWGRSKFLGKGGERKEEGREEEEGLRKEH